MNKKIYKVVLSIIFILAIIIRLAYVIKMPYNKFQHDIDPDRAGGLAYIFTIYEETVLISMLFMFYIYAFTREDKKQIEEKESKRKEE